MFLLRFSSSCISLLKFCTFSFRVASMSIFLVSKASNCFAYAEICVKNPKMDRLILVTSGMLLLELTETSGRRPWNFEGVASESKHRNRLKSVWLHIHLKYMHIYWVFLLFARCNWTNNKITESKMNYFSTFSVIINLFCHMK